MKTETCDCGIYCQDAGAGRCRYTPGWLAVDGKRCCATCANGQRTTEQGWPHGDQVLIACSVHLLGDTQDWYAPEHCCEQWKEKRK